MFIRMLGFVQEGLYQPIIFQKMQIFMNVKKIRKTVLAGFILMILLEFNPPIRVRNHIASEHILIIMEVITFSTDFLNIMVRWKRFLSISSVLVKLLPVLDKKMVIKKMS